MISRVISIFALAAAGLGAASMVSWIRRSRKRAAFDPARHGLVPRAELDPGRAGPHRADPGRETVAEVVLAARRGEWKQAAAYVEAAGEDWDERWSRVELLRELAQEDDDWLQRWRGARPESGDAATVRAGLLLHRAWSIRGGAYADQVSPADMATFRRMLPDAMKAAHEASGLAPDDPGPWVVMVTAARALDYDHGQFSRLFEELRARAPHHWAGHLQALQYWAPKWHGSQELMGRFAGDTLALAPPGSVLCGVYLHALDEAEAQRGRRGLPTTAEDKEMLLIVARGLATVPETDPRLPGLRHLLAYHLTRCGMYEAALPVFRAIGPWCGAEPWRKGGRDPVDAFDEARTTAALEVARNRG
ncbi:Uncharacterised protein [Streptomyces griseus]|uniref:DUF4034 domain-containing protein n=1 Tax=Streptomyces griseus TaxID=1911 RepID=A0A380MLI4_STRGR|nr:Uncharacterised protein [Streptomyces griseus]